MKTMIRSLTVFSCICLALALVSPDAFAKKRPKLPDVTTDGLVRVVKPKSKATAVYMLPGADLSGYDKIILLEPGIAFQKNWKSDYNSSRRLDRIDDRDMENMIARGKKIFLEQFTKTLEKKGYPVVHAAEGNVMLVRAAIIDLTVFAADPNRTAGTRSKVYTEYAAEATLVLEIYDSLTGQIIVRAIDRKNDIGDNFGWAQSRTQFSNINDARSAFHEWALMLTNGLKRAKEEAAK